MTFDPSPLSPLPPSASGGQLFTLQQGLNVVWCYADKNLGGSIRTYQKLNNSQIEVIRKSC